MVVDLKDFDNKLTMSVNENKSKEKLMEFIRLNDTDFEIISKSNLLYDDFLKVYIDKFDWNFDYLTLNNKISLQYILDNIKYFKNYKLISRRLHQEYNNIINGQNSIYTSSIHSNYISSISNKALLRKLIRTLEDNISKNWDFNYLSKSGLITMEFIEENINKNWNYQFNGILCNPNLTLNFIKKFINKPWDFDELTKLFNITKSFNDFVLHKMLTSTFKQVSIPLSFIEETIDKPWDFKYLSQFVKINEEKYLYDENKSIIPLDFVYKYRMLNWDFELITKKRTRYDDPELDNKYPHFPWVKEIINALYELPKPKLRVNGKIVEISEMSLSTKKQVKNNTCGSGSKSVELDDFLTYISNDENNYNEITDSEISDDEI